MISIWKKRLSAIRSDWQHVGSLAEPGVQKTVGDRFASLSNIETDQPSALLDLSWGSPIQQVFRPLMPPRLSYQDCVGPSKRHEKRGFQVRQPARASEVSDGMAPAHPIDDLLEKCRTRPLLSDATPHLPRAIRLDRC
ncbi:hypothetical protein X766_34285 [Mesorhizobium sp. LSJC255A00]|nr:hypothetical protein X766_34285 [Mesorhizobium sp. LSJC255A00]